MQYPLLFDCGWLITVVVGGDGGGGGGGGVCMVCVAPLGKETKKKQETIRTLAVRTRHVIAIG